MSFLRQKNKRKSEGGETNQYAELEELKNFHSGWLTKSALFRSKQYYCTLSGNWLSFWKDTAEHQEANSPKKSDSIDMITVNQVMRSTSAKVHNGFDIVIAKERITLSAQNMKECDTWIQKLQLAMQYKMRAASMRQSSLARCSELEADLSASAAPLYEDPFDTPSAPTTPMSEAKPISEPAQSADPPPLPSDRKPSIPMDEQTVSNCPTTTTDSVTATPVKPVLALYEEVDISPTTKAPPVADKPYRPQPVARHSVEGKDNQSGPKAVPKPRPSVRKTKLLMPALRECEDDATEEANENVNGDIAEQEEKTHNEVKMRSSVSTPSDEKGLPSVNDLYAAIQKDSNTNTAADRISSIWAAMEERSPERVSTKIEPESQAIRELRKLLNVAEPSPVVRDTVIEHKQLERGQHMQALHDLLYN